MACPARAKARVLESRSRSYRRTVSTPWREVRGEARYENESGDFLTQWVEKVKENKDCKVRWGFLAPEALVVPKGVREKGQIYGCT